MLVNLAQENNIGNYVNHYMISNKQNDSGRKDSMKFLQKLTYTFADNCLYIKKEKDKIVLIILVYINDMAVAAPRNIYITSFKMALCNDFDITDLGELKFMLEILVTYDCTN